MPLLKSHIKAIESGNPWIHPIPSENQGRWQNETEIGAAEGLQSVPASTAPLETTEAAEDTSVEHHTREPSADEPGNQTDIQEFLEQMTDAEFSEFEKFLAEEAPELSEFQNAGSIKTELGERFSPERFKTAMDILSRYGPEKGFRRLKATDPELAAELERLIESRRNPEEPPQ